MLVGEELIVLDDLHHEWMMVENSKKQKGYVPKNYVKIKENTTQKVTPVVKNQKSENEFSLQKIQEVEEEGTEEEKKEVVKNVTPNNNNQQKNNLQQNQRLSMNQQSFTGNQNQIQQSNSQQGLRSQSFTSFPSQQNVQQNNQPIQYIPIQQNNIQQNYQQQNQPIQQHSQSFTMNSQQNQQQSFQNFSGNQNQQLMNQGIKQSQSFTSQPIQMNYSQQNIQQKVNFNQQNFSQQSQGNFQQNYNQQNQFQGNYVQQNQYQMNQKPIQQNQNFGQQNLGNIQDNFLKNLQNLNQPFLQNQQKQIPQQQYYQGSNQQYYQQPQNYQQMNPNQFQNQSFQNQNFGSQQQFQSQQIYQQQSPKPQVQKQSFEQYQQQMQQQRQSWSQQMDQGSNQNMKPIQQPLQQGLNQSFTNQPIQQQVNYVTQQNIQQNQQFQQKPQQQNQPIQQNVQQNQKPQQFVQAPVQQQLLPNQFNQSYQQPNWMFPQQNHPPLVNQYGQPVHVNYLYSVNQFGQTVITPQYIVQGTSMNQSTGKPIETIKKDDRRQSVKEEKKEENKRGSIKEENKRGSIKEEKKEENKRGSMKDDPKEKKVEVKKEEPKTPKETKKESKVPKEKRTVDKKYTGWRVNFTSVFTVKEMKEGFIKQLKKEANVEVFEFLLDIEKMSNNNSKESCDIFFTICEKYVAEVLNVSGKVRTEIMEIYKAQKSKQEWDHSETPVQVIDKARGVAFNDLKFDAFPRFIGSEEGFEIISKLIDNEEVITESPLYTVMYKIKDSFYGEKFENENQVKLFADDLSDKLKLKDGYLSLKWAQTEKLENEIKKFQKDSVNEEYYIGAFMDQQLKRNIRIKIVVIEKTKPKKLGFINFLSPILNTIQGQGDEIYHTALLIGPWLFEWDESELCIPKKCISSAAILSADVDELCTLKSLDDKLDKLSEVIVDWNVNKSYKISGGDKEKCGNSQDFVESVLNAIDVKLQLPEALQTFLKKMKDQGKSKLEFIMSSDFQKKFGFSESSVQFSSHMDVDGLMMRFLDIDKNFKYNHKGEYLYLKSFDRAYWMKFLNLRNDYSKLYQQYQQSKSDQLLKQLKSLEEEIQKNRPCMKGDHAHCPFDDPTRTNSILL